MRGLSFCRTQKLLKWEQNKIEDKNANYILLAVISVLQKIPSEHRLWKYELDKCYDQQWKFEMKKDPSVPMIAESKSRKTQIDWIGKMI